jgi:hypothetical protein
MPDCLVKRKSTPYHHFKNVESVSWIRLTVDAQVIFMNHDIAAISKAKPTIGFTNLTYAIDIIKK